MPMNVCCEAGARDGHERAVERRRDRPWRASSCRCRAGPRKSTPRSRLPPAFSNSSPDCQSDTMRVISSFASTWPRTSPSLHAPVRVAGLVALDLLGAEQEHRAEQDQEVDDEEQEQDQRVAGRGSGEDSGQRCRGARRRRRRGCRPGSRARSRRARAGRACPRRTCGGTSCASTTAAAA